MYAKSQTLPETIKVQSDNGSLRLQFSTKYNPIFEGKRKYQGLGMKDTPENLQKAIAIAWRIEGDLQHPDWQQLFDPSFAKYGLKSKYTAELKLAAPIPEPEPEITVGEMWENYLEWKKTVVEETTFKATYERKFSNLVYGKIWDNSSRAYQKLDNCSLSEISLNSKQLSSELAKIQSHAKTLFLKELKRAFDFSKTKGLLRNDFTIDPFIDLGEYAVPVQTTQQKYAPKLINGEEKEWHEVLDGKELEENRRAFTKEERDIIIKAFYESESCATSEYIAPLIEFYFLTGCRTSEAFALTWKDIDFERRVIRFSKSLGATTGKVKETKTGEVRLFYFKKDSRLESMLLTVKQRNIDSKLVFTNTKGGRLTASLLKSHWLYYINKRTLADGTTKSYYYPGIVRQLADEGKISGYLPQYHTRHTFITLAAQANKHDNNALLYIATACGNSVDVILKHYLGATENTQIIEA